ncbi:MAG: hypothetical protein LWW81_04115 [Rhodocyclales bacterium]|nr:hypothetical protein [Rhodocyclales bacterium]
MGKSSETVKDRGIVLDQFERTKNLIAKKLKNRKMAWAVNSSYAAVFSILSSSSKLEAILPLAERVGAAAKSADSAKLAT